MTGMKVAISLPDPVFRAAEVLARKLRKSRSELYAEAIAAYVGSKGAKALTARLNAVYAKQP
jgi:predicted transcriptional regulator